MRLPIDTRELRFVVAKPPEAVKAFGTDQIKTDREGRPIYTVDVLAVGNEKPEVLTIKLPGPAEAQELEPVELVGLTAEYWEMGDRSGVSFRAELLNRPTLKTPRDAGSKPKE